MLDVEFDAQPDAAASVKRVTVRDAATGRVLTTPERGRPFTIELAVELGETITDLSVAIILVDELGLVIIDDDVRDRPLPGHCPASQASTSSLRRSRPCCGRAGTRSAAGSETTNEHSIERDLLTIRLAPRADDPQYFSELSRAVQPEIEWKILQEPVP